MNHRPIFLAYVTIISVLAMSMDLENETNNRTIGFTLDLIQIDSPQSPFYDPTLSSSQRMENVLRRSLDRIHHFKTGIKYGDPPQVVIVSHTTGYYLMKFSIGTPPIPVFAIPDTGSEVIWLQCQPCVRCFPQNLPIFNPKGSATYSKVPYFSDACRFFKGSFGDEELKNCLYEESYVDKSYTKGVVSRDTITLPTSHGRNLSFLHIEFGCGHDNGGTLRSEETGIVGLNEGPNSLISQLDYVVQGKFSYCLVSLIHEISASSKMNFGANAIVSGPGTVSTPLYTKRSHYYLALEGVSIDGLRLEFSDYSSNNSKFTGGGNIIIDSGTVFTYIPQEFYDPIKEKLKRIINYEHISIKHLELCFVLGKDILVFPFMTFHFKGADVKLRRDNVFLRVSDDIICFAILPDKVHGVAIFGNYAQRNFMVGYDLKKRTVSFKPTDCVRFS